MSSTLAILKTAQIVASPGLLGGEKRIQNRAAVELTLERHRRWVMILTLGLLLLIVGIVVEGMVLAATHPEQIAKGFVPYLGGATFLGLLEVARRQIREYTTATLPLTLSKFLSEDEYARFIQSLISLDSPAARRGKPGRRGSVARKA